MLLGAGVDLIEKERFAGWLQRPGVRRRFAPAELAYAERFGAEQRQNEALAAAFAAKEAFFKAAAALLGEAAADNPADTGLFWAAWVEHEEDGRPRMQVSEPWGARLRELGAERFWLSISHDQSQVLAVVIISSQNEPEAEAVLERLTPAGFEPLAGNDGVCLVDEGLAAGWLPRRRRDAYKGNFGHVLVVGGSDRYVGAPKMAAEAALRGGAGLVTLAGPKHISPLSPEVMRLPVPTAGGCLQSGAIVLLQQELQGAGRVLCLGMGLGRKPETCLLVRRLAALTVPKVIDADGLFALAEMANNNAHGIRLPENTVLTPHTGEMARLLDCSAAEVEADRLGAVRRCAVKYNAVVALKGPGTCVCGPADGEPVYVNTTGNPGMATGGSGDVLAGLAAAWLAQGLGAGLTAVQATALAVYLHGLAGDLAAEEKSEYSLTALDIVRYLGMAYKRLLS